MKVRSAFADCQTRHPVLSSSFTQAHFSDACKFSKEDPATISRYSDSRESPLSEQRVHGKTLDKDSDAILAEHVVRQGAYQRIRDRHVFEKDGVVVIMSSSTWSLDSFVLGYMFEGAMLRAHQKYDALLDMLDEAPDSEARLRVLSGTLEGEDGTYQRVFNGLDLLVQPPDCPLLQRCALEGYSECMLALSRNGHGDG